MNLAGFSVRRPVTTAMFFIAFSLLGSISWTQLSVQLFPELIFPEVVVALTLQGGSPEQIEKDLILPTEEEIGKLNGVETFESYALANRGGVQVSYAPGTDMKFALLQLQNRMTRLQSVFPEQTRMNIKRFDSSDLTTTVMQLDVIGNEDLNWLRDFAEEKIRPELEAIDGVANATVRGGRRIGVDVIVNPQLMEAHKLSLGQIRSSINAFNRRRVYLGKVYAGEKTYPVSISGQFSDLQEIRTLVLRSDIPLHLGDVAKIQFGLQEQTDLQRVNGKASVGISIQKDDEGNLIRIARDIEDNLKRLNHEFANEGVSLAVNISQAEMMEGALDTLKQAAVVGAVLGLFVLFLFLRNLRFVSVLLLAIPVSLLLTFNLMYACSLSLNVLSLCGLALAVGMLTDNGIVVMESIFKHFEEGKSPTESARDGTAEVGRAVVASTATTVTVFLPVVFIQSDAQVVLQELALSMAFPVLVSLLVALTLVPTLAAQTLSYRIHRPPKVGKLLEVYTLLLKAGLRNQFRISVMISLFLVATLLISFIFMIQQDVRNDETRLTVYVDLPEGSTLEATDEVVKQVESVVMGVEGLDRFTTRIQKAQASITVLLKKIWDRPSEISVEEIKIKLDEDFQKISGGVVGYQAQSGRGGRGGRTGGIRGKRRNTGGFNLTGGITLEQAVIRGYDFPTLQMIVDDLTFRLEDLVEIDVNSVQADVQRGSPEVQVIPDEVSMFDRRIQLRTVLNSVGDARTDGFHPSVPFLTLEGLEVPISVRTTENPNDDGLGLDGFKKISVLTPNGYVSLEEVAQVRTDDGRSSILRTDQARRSIVTYQFTSEILSSQPQLEEARLIVQDLIRDMVLPEGYSIELVESEEETIYYWMMGIASILIYMILASVFESFSSPIIILCTLPPAVIGSCWALMLSGNGLTQQEGPMALLGFIVLLGIAVNNGILLIDAIGTLRTKHGFRRERAVLTAGRSRVRPILMTSATTLLGVLPLALQFGGDYEIWPPFAITVCGGLVVSMFSTLIFIPVVYMGLDQVIDWFKDIGLFGITLGTLLTGVTCYGIHTYYESLFWTSLSTLPFWFAFLALIWIGLQIHRSRVNGQNNTGTVGSIHLRNLTKVYGAPGKFMQEWGRFDRRFVRLMSIGVDPVDRTAVKYSLGWKFPLLLFFGYLHTYFVEEIWIYLLSLITWGILVHLLKCLGALWTFHLCLPWWIVRPMKIISRSCLPVCFLGYVHWRLNLTSITVFSFGVWLSFQSICFLVDRIRSGKVDLQRIGGFQPFFKRWVYQGAAAIPLLGIDRPEFQALSGINLKINRGMFGLLGPNGAGKTTLMRIICQVLKPSYGSVIVNNKNILQHSKLQGLIGYLPQHFGLYDHLSAYDFLEYRALLEGFKDTSVRQARVIECLKQVNLLDRQGDPIGSFSGGMRQRVGIAQTLLHMPQVIVVDEPTAGLDPMERIRFRNLLAKISKDRIVIFSTHIVEDISGSCNHLAVLKTGRILYTGTPQSMRDLVRNHVWEAIIPEKTFIRIENELSLVAHLRTSTGVRTRFLSDSPPENLKVHSVDPTLEDAYLHLLRNE